MDAKHAEALSTFFDGEEVDGALLTESLSQLGALQMLIDFSAMRARIQTGRLPSAELLSTIGTKVQRSARRRLWLYRLGRVAVAMCLVFVAGGVGFKLASIIEHAGPRPVESVVVPTPTAPTHAVTTTQAPVLGPPPIPRTGSVPRRPDQPPVARLRLRLGQQWRESLADADGEPRR